MPQFNASSDQIKKVLKEAKTIAVVGASPKPERPSHDVALYLKNAGYKVIPVNPGQKEIFGETCYPSLLEVPEKVDIVDIFRDPSAVPEIVDQAIKVGAKAVWMQLGIVHNEAAQKAKDAGLEVVMNKCTKIEHARLS